MSKRSNGGDPSSTAHKRHAAAPQDESPLPSATSSLLTQASSSSIPNIPLDLIADLILPFVADRVAWNSVYSACKDLCLAGKKMTPPWPNTTLNFGQAVRSVVFSPSGSQLAFARYSGAHDLVHVWDRWGEEALLVGHAMRRIVNCLEYSCDGEYLASGCHDGSIRLWHAESLHAASLKISRQTPTRATERAGIVLVGSRHNLISTLSFSRTDSNLLASGGSNGEIKLWNVKDQACIHSVQHPRLRAIGSLFFAGGANICCTAVSSASTGPIVRFWKAEGSSDFATEIIGKGGATGLSTFSPSGSFLAFTSYSDVEDGQTLALFELETMTNTQSIIMPGFEATCFAFSPDSKQMAYGDCMGIIRLVQTDDFSIRRDLSAKEESSIMSVTFDPTCRVLACGYLDGALELRHLLM